MAQWIKQLTRENTLLDRSLRTIAYYKSVSEIGEAHFAQCPVVGRGGMTSMYYNKKDYHKQQAIILREFNGLKADRMGRKIAKFLELGYLWALKNKNRSYNAQTLQRYIKELCIHDAHARGSIVYGYWGEPVITKKLKNSLSIKLKGSGLDNTLSILSTPKKIVGPLLALYQPAKKIEKEKQKLIEKLRLHKKQKDLVEILSWFTFFYEVGERVSSLLYDELLKKLKKHVKGEKEFKELMWYDPNSLIMYLRGKRLPKSELSTRKKCYILSIEKGKLKILSGDIAERTFQKNFDEKVSTHISELKGTVASLGIARGSVKIIITQEDQKKMNNGDILISTMTTPRLMLAVKKAAAIVTDEGGLTAHAAIVSRELGIPCIVGTKIATKVLVDGDLVEVDAVKGLVKKIK